MIDKSENFKQIFFQCDQCKKELTFPHFITAAAFYGMIFLFGKDYGYFGIVCPQCLNTTLVKDDKKGIKSLKDRFFSLVGNFAGLGEPILRYDSFPYSLDHHKEKAPKFIYRYMTQLGEIGSLEEFQVEDLLYNNSLGLSEGYHTYFFGDLAIGRAIAVWWFREEDIADLVQIENETRLKIFPRYVLYDRLYDTISGFCWQHYLDLETTLQHEGPEWEEQSIKKSFFFNILTTRPNQLHNSFPASFNALLNTLHLFDGSEFQKSLEDFDADKKRTTKDGPSHSDMVNEVNENINEKYIQEALSTLSGKFIDEYMESALKVNFSWNLAWALKKKYLKQLYEAIPHKGEPKRWEEGLTQAKSDLAREQATSLHTPEAIPHKEETKKNKEEISQAKTLVDLARAQAAFFHTPGKETFACIQAEDHEENLSLDSKSIELWLRQIFGEAKNNVAKAQAIKDAVETLKATKSPEQEVSIRIGGTRDVVYIDLANKKWEQIEITKDGWRLISNRDSPVKFKRSDGMLPLPYPSREGSLELLRDLLNVQEREHEWILILSWIIGATQPKGPFPILILEGEHGTAKSTTARIVRDLIDPSTVPLRSPPKSERDLAIAANGTWVLSFDNISGLTPQLSDAFCRLATGGGFATRELYTDRDEVIFNAKRPLVMNGISDIASRHDLADRALIVNLPPILGTKRRTEKELWEHLGQMKPGFLGGLCNAISETLRNVKNANPPNLPRMADFALWVTCAEPALPWENGLFLNEYSKYFDRLVDTNLAADIVGTAVLELMEGQTEWSGTPTDLLKALSTTVPESVERSQEWPKQPNILSSRIKRTAPFLREKGVEVESYKSGQRKIIIKKVR